MLLWTITPYIVRRNNDKTVGVCFNRRSEANSTYLHTVINKRYDVNIVQQFSERVFQISKININRRLLKKNKKTNNNNNEYNER